jgi:hypothetical protein
LFLKNLGIKEYLVNPMQTQQKIFFIISGIREGFKRSHLLCNNEIKEVIDYIGDIRGITNSAVESFYSIEKTNNYTLASIFNPNTIDHVDRKAYIAITLFVKNDYIIKGNLIGALHHLMNYYEQKQGKELTNTFTEEMFESEYANLQIEQVSNSEKGTRSKQGYIFYDQTSEIAMYFDNPSINGYQKVYFLSSKNIGVANQLINFDKIVAFPKGVVYKIHDFGKGNYNLLINNQSYSTVGNLHLNTLTLNINQGDTITIENISNKTTKSLVAVSTDTDIYVEDFFPAQYASNPIQSTGNTGTKGHSYPNSPKKKANKTVLLAAAAMIPFVIGIGIYKMVNQPPTIIKPTPVPAVVVQPSSTVNTPPNTDTDSNTTNINTETQSNPPNSKKVLDSIKKSKSAAKKEEEKKKKEEEKKKKEEEKKKKKNGKSKLDPDLSNSTLQFMFNLNNSCRNNKIV